MKFKIKDLPNIFIETFNLWIAKYPFNLSAILAYYSILSLPALLILIIDLVGSVWGREIVQGKLTNEISTAFGIDTANFIREIITNKGSESTSLTVNIIGVCTLLYGATGVFYQLQNVLDKIWNFSPTYTNGILATLIERLKSFGFILIFGFLLLISFVLTSGLSAFSEHINKLLPDGFLQLAHIFNVLISLGFIYFLFAAMFKFLPSSKVRWKAVKSGAALTAILFVLGKYVLAFYFAKAEPGSTYGAAGSVILVMLWVSYSSLILLFGAQFTKVYSDKYGIS